MNLYQPADAQAENAAGQDGPFWTEEEYQRLVAEMVTAETPTVFALVEDRDDRLDGRIAAWVLEFSSGTEVITTEGHTWMSLMSTDRVLRRFGRRPGITARLIRTVNPEPAQ